MGHFFTVFHVFVANIVLKWRNNGILVQRKHLFITFKMFIFIYTTRVLLNNDRTRPNAPERARTRQNMRPNATEQARTKYGSPNLRPNATLPFRLPYRKFLFTHIKKSNSYTGIVHVLIFFYFHFIMAN